MSVVSRYSGLLSCQDNKSQVWLSNKQQNFNSAKFVVPSTKVCTTHKALITWLADHIIMVMHHAWHGTSLVLTNIVQTAMTTTTTTVKKLLEINAQVFNNTVQSSLSIFKSMFKLNLELSNNRLNYLSVDLHYFKEIGPVIHHDQECLLSKNKQIYTNFLQRVRG